MKTIENSGSKASDSPVNEEPLIIKLSFSQEVMISTLFLITGLLLLIFTEPDLNLTLPAPFSDILLFLRAIINSVILLFIPGFALTNLLFMDHEKMDFIERIALSCGLSISLVILAGFILAGSEITAFTIYYFIAVLTIVFIITKQVVRKISHSEKAQLALDDKRRSLKEELRSWNLNVDSLTSFSIKRNNIHELKGEEFTIRDLKGYFKVKNHLIIFFYTIIASIILIITSLGINATPDESLFFPITLVSILVLFIPETAHLTGHYLKSRKLTAISTVVCIIIVWIISFVIAFIIEILFSPVDFRMILIIDLLIIYEIVILQIYSHIQDENST